MSNAPESNEILTRYLVESGKLAPADVEQARQLVSETPQSFGLLLARVGLVSDRDLAAAYAAVFNRPLLSDDSIPLAPPPEQPCKESFLRDARIVPLSSNEHEVSIATADPENRFALDALAMTTGKAVSYSIGTIDQIDRALDRWYGDGDVAAEGLVGEETEDPEESEAIDRLRDLASEAPVVRLVNSIIQRAVEAGASDIHVEPFEAELRIRYRIDGVLRVVDIPAVRSPAAIVSRIKLMAKMNIAERRLPQDGRMHIRIQGSSIDLRASTIPTIDGESVVLRILDQDRASLELEALGFDEALCSALLDLISLPHGIVLVTGPTGSGKTTTLYAALQRLNANERKIVTIEDPVEYQLQGINQVQIKPQIGLDFAQALRSIVRQDPDVVMVGEMRDLETARIAVQSALTGHLVLSTLHTNDAGSSVTRLLDMGIEDYLVTSSVNGILAQRLVRRLCPACRTPYTPTDTLRRELDLNGLGAPSSPVTLYAASDCPECEHTGYRGRTVIAELMRLDEHLRRAILDQSDGKTLERLAIEGGMRTMTRDGLSKALDGTTTLEEVTRVTLE